MYVLIVKIPHPMKHWKVTEATQMAHGQARAECLERIGAYQGI